MLTWRMYFRHTFASIESLLFMLIFIFWIAFVWWLFGAIADRSLSHGFTFITPELLFADVFIFIFIIWLVFSLIGYRLNESYDLNRFRIYPLPLREIFWANITGSFLDINILPPLAAFVVILVKASPTIVQFFPGLLIILAYLFFLILAGHTIAIILYVLLPRLSTIRIGIIILFALLAWSLFMGIGGIRNYESWFNFYVFFRPWGIEVFRPFPMGAAGVAIGAILDNDWSSVWQTVNDQGETSYPLPTLIAWIGALLVLNYLLHALWIEHDVKKQIPESRVREGEFGPAFLNVLGKLLIPLVGATAFELYRKDMLEYAFRSPYFLIYKVFPGSIAPIIIVYAMKWNLDPESNLFTSNLAREVGLIATVCLIIFIVVGQAVLFAGNQFGFEDSNIRELMSLPTPRREYLLGKNLFFATLFFIDALIVSFLATLFFPGLYTFFVVFSLLLAIFLIILSIGNFTSAMWPYWMPLDKPSFSLRSTLILGLVNLGVTIVMLVAFVPAAALVVVPGLLGYQWLSWLMMPFGVAYGILFHHLTMRPASSLFESNEFLVLRRVADREQL